MRFIVNVQCQDAIRTGLEPGDHEVSIDLADLSREDREALFECSSRISDNLRRLRGPVLAGRYDNRDYHVPFQCPDTPTLAEIVIECHRCLNEQEVLRRRLLEQAQDHIRQLRNLPANPDLPAYRRAEMMNRLTRVSKDEEDALQEYLSRCESAAAEREKPAADEIRKVGHLPLTAYGEGGMKTVKHIVGPLRDALGDDYDRLYKAAVERAEELNSAALKQEEARKAEVRARMLEWLRDSRGENLLADKIEEGFSCGAELHEVAFEQASARICPTAPQNGCINPCSDWDGEAEVRNPSNAAFVVYRDLKRLGVSCSIGLSTRIRQEDEADEEDLGRQEVIFCEFPCPWDPDRDKSYTRLVVSGPLFRHNV